MSRLQSPSTRLAFLDGVRGIAAMYVVFHHAMLTLPPASGAGTIERALLTVGQWGHYGVDVFIVLSGYCLMLPLLRPGAIFDASTFLERRALRILPTYYVATLGSLLLIRLWLASPAGTHWDVCLPVTRHDVAYHLLLIHELFAASALKINHALWSIGVEWKIYFLFPLLLAAFRRFGELTATVVAIAAGYTAWLVCAAFHVMNPGPWGASFYYVGLFTLGMFAAVRSPRPTGVSSDGAAAADGAWTTALVIASIAAVAVSMRDVVPWQIRSLFVGAWASVLFVALSRDLAPSWLARVLTLRPTVWVGRMGYSIYLVHAPVLELVYRYVVRTWAPSTPWRAPVMVATSLTATVLVAPPFFRLAEQPFHRLSRTLGMRGEADRRNGRAIAARRTGT